MGVFQSCMGKIWGKAGLEDMLVGSELYASLTAKYMLMGKHFHRCTRAFTLVFEALWNLLLENFLKWLQDNNDDCLDAVQIELSKAQEQYKDLDFSWKNLGSLQSNLSTNFLAKLDQFRQLGRKRSATFQFWDNSLTALNLMLCSIRAEREDDWMSHLSSHACMIPYFFICDKPNYSRYCPLYILEMVLKLPSEVLNDLLKGHSIKFSPGAFRGVWSDMGVEMSVIRDSKGEAGWIKFSRSGSCIARWTLSQHMLGLFTKQMSIRSGFEDDPFHCITVHEQETSKAMFNRDEKDLQTLVNHIKLNMIDPFELVDSDQIVQLNSGLLAGEIITESLLSVFKKGRELMNKFVDERLDIENECRTSFYEPITKCNLKTFDNLQKETMIRLKNQSYKKAISAESVYQRALMVAEKRLEVNLEMVLSYPITAVPSALFTSDGCFRKIKNKAALIHCLEKNIQSQKEFPRSDSTSTIYVIDAMAEIHTLVIMKLKTFGDVGQVIAARILKRLKQCKEVH